MERSPWQHCCLTHEIYLLSRVQHNQPKVMLPRIAADLRSRALSSGTGGGPMRAGLKSFSPASTVKAGGGAHDAVIARYMRVLHQQHGYVSESEAHIAEQVRAAYRAVFGASANSGE